MHAKISYCPRVSGQIVNQLWAAISCSVAKILEEDLTQLSRLWVQSDALLPELEVTKIIGQKLPACYSQMWIFFPILDFLVPQAYALCNGFLSDGREGGGGLITFLFLFIFTDLIYFAILIIVC
jgi:hypothetical protein